MKTDKYKEVFNKNRRYDELYNMQFKDGWGISIKTILYIFKVDTFLLINIAFFDKNLVGYYFLLVYRIFIIRDIYIVFLSVSFLFNRYTSQRT